MHFVHFLLWQLPNHASRLNKFSWARTMYSTSLKTVELQSKSLYSWMYETKSESRASCNSCSGSFQTMLCGYETICYEIETTLMSTHTVQHITESLRCTFKNLIFLNVWKTIRIICFVQLMLWKLSSHALCQRNHAHIHFYIVCLQCWQARFLMKQHKCVNAWQSHYKDVFVWINKTCPSQKMKQNLQTLPKWWHPRNHSLIQHTDNWNSMQTIRHDATVELTLTCLPVPCLLGLQAGLGGMREA